MHDLTSDTIDGPRLARYVSGQCTADEAAAVRRWALADLEHATLLAELEGAWRAGGHAPYDWRVDDGWQAFVAARAAKQDGKRLAHSVTVGASRRSRSWPGVVAMTASLVVVLAVGLMVGVRPQQHGPSTTGRTYVTRAGQRLSVTLTDGTRLTLAPASQVRVTSAREVELEGEAYFAAVHDAAHPFAVRTPWAVTRDVGTAFDVRAYADDRRTRIVVQEGAVAVGSNRPSVTLLTLNAGTLAVVDPAGQVSVRRGVSLTPYLGWIQGHLAFSDVPFRDVARDLARTFDLDVTVADSTLDRQLVTASFTDQPVDVVLETVTAIVGARYERSGRAVVIRRRTRGTADPAAAAARNPLSTALARAHDE